MEMDKLPFVTKRSDSKVFSLVLKLLVDDFNYIFQVIMKIVL